MNEIGPGSTVLTFLSGYVQSRDIVRVITQIQEISAVGNPYTWIIKWSRTPPRWHRFELQWLATRMWMLDENGPALFIAGPEGRVMVVTGSGPREERICGGESGDPCQGVIRDLRAVGQHLYACGMGRQVYRREGPGLWKAHHGDMVLPPDSLTMAGLNAIDGLSEDDLYAVGFLGEIWHYGGAGWRQLESPTNVILHRVRNVRKGVTYACGQMGVVLRGSNLLWELLAHNSTDEDLWGMEWFQERLYVASSTAVYVLGEDSLLRRVSPPGVSCGHLHANDDVMWSFGGRYLMSTTNGTDWQDQTPPEDRR